jgi:hypothetical protein
MSHPLSPDVASLKAFFEKWVSENPPLFEKTENQHPWSQDEVTAAIEAYYRECVNFKPIPVDYTEVFEPEIDELDVEAL